MRACRRMRKRALSGVLSPAVSSTNVPICQVRASVHTPGVFKADGPGIHTGVSHVACSTAAQYAADVPEGLGK